MPGVFPMTTTDTRFRLTERHSGHLARPPSPCGALPVSLLPRPSSCPCCTTSHRGRLVEKGDAKQAGEARVSLCHPGQPANQPCERGQSTEGSAHSANVQ